MITVVRFAVIIAALAAGWLLGFDLTEMAVLWLMLLTITTLWEPLPKRRT